MTNKRSILFPDLLICKLKKKIFLPSIAKQAKPITESLSMKDVTGLSPSVHARQMALQVEGRCQPLPDRKSVV